MLRNRSLTIGHCTIIFILCSISLSLRAEDKLSMRIMAYNVEALFDTAPDSLHADGEFLPDGAYHWTYSRYRTKLAHIAQVISAVGEWQAPALVGLLEIAKLQSTEASNRIEGIITTEDRLKKLVREKITPINRSEKEIAGYRDVLATIHESYEYITPRPNNILQLHRDLYSFSSSSAGGAYKNSDNVIAETGTDGKSRARFIPVPAFQTADAMEQLCSNFIDAMEEGRYDPLVLVPMFILDFLCIHPFNDGNGRMSRLLTLLLLYRCGYIVGKYISVEMLIEKSK